MIYSRHRRSFVADLSVKETVEVSYVKDCGLSSFIWQFVPSMKVPFFSFVTSVSRIVHFDVCAKVC
jgi:uncharacterized membrane protein YdfJ with MMPL/SSD domain